MNTRSLAPLTALAIGLTLSGCVQYATVSEHRPIFRPGGGAISGEIESRIEGALKRGPRDPMRALGGYLAAADTAARALAGSPDDHVIRDEYNFAVSRIISTIQEAKLDPWTGPLTVPARGGSYMLTRKPDVRTKWNPALYDLKAADQFDVGGSYVRERHVKEGVGAPLVAIGREMNADARETFALARTYYGVTAIARFSGRRCEIAFEDPLAVETASLAGRSFPLAADFTVPVAVMLASTHPKKLGLARLLNPGKYADTARIARLQPYDPGKTVVLVVHGLNSEPSTWTPMINALRASEEIRSRYQFWFYSYPSGYPYPHSAAILRRELDAIEKRFPVHRRMVVIGHSMGGCISRLLITDVGGRLWMDYFGRPPEQVEMSAESKQFFKEALIFRERPEVGRVIFIAAPLKGADIASGWLGRLGSRLVRAPVALLAAGREMLQVATLASDGLHLRRIPNSLDTLAPNSRFALLINKFPLSATTPYHTIIGDRGKGGHKDKTKPVSSDGFVPYWSSHLDHARSELVIPSRHSAHQHPQAIEEVKRILLLHRGARRATVRSS